MSKTILIREATKDDRDALVRFNEAMAWETEEKSLARERLSAGVDAVLNDRSKGFYLIAAIEDQAAGGLLVTSEWSDWRNAFFWWIQSVYVEPRYRKTGVYKALHRKVEDLARLSGDVCGIRLYVDRDNTRAKATYEHLGMTEGRYNFYERKLDTDR
jgi:GNAT superfamily N-acetyltransferase